MNQYPPERKPGTYVSHVSPSGTPAGPPTSPEPLKRKLSTGFFILGFVTPWLVAALTGAATGLFGQMGAVSSFFAVALPGGTFLAQLAAWVIGRSNGNDRLRSWGLGGMATAVLQALAVLLLFGACAIGLATY